MTPPMLPSMIKVSPPRANCNQLHRNFRLLQIHQHSAVRRVLLRLRPVPFNLLERPKSFPPINFNSYLELRLQSLRRSSYQRNLLKVNFTINRPIKDRKLKLPPPILRMTDSVNGGILYVQ
ncbi:MAG: hypothetical protein ACTS80_00485 [Candidatus Hodgkinia cicadicola]